MSDHAPPLTGPGDQPRFLPIGADPAVTDRIAIRMVAFIDQLLARHKIRHDSLTRMCSCGRWRCDVRDLARDCQLIP